MADKIDQNKTKTTYWRSIASHLKHEQFARSSIFEHGPEFATTNNPDTSVDERMDIFNKATAIAFDKLFAPNLNVLGDAGDSVCAQIHTVLTNRVGRNRTYTTKDIRDYIEVAANKYAIMQGIKNAAHVATMVPRVAYKMSNYRTAVDLYNEYYNIINVNFPLPEDLAKFIDEYVIQVLEDRDGTWSKGLILFTDRLEVYNRLHSNPGSFECDFMTITSTGSITDYLKQTPTGQYISIARDIASYVKCRQLTSFENANTIYPLDAKHQATLINTCKANEAGFDLNNDPNKDGDDTKCESIHVSTCSGPNGIERMVGSEKEVNINYWDSLCRNLPKNFGEDTSYECQSLVIIDAVRIWTHDGEDDEDIGGAMLVQHADRPSEIDEIQLMLFYIDLFGGVNYRLNSTTPDLEYGYQVEPLRCASYGISARQLDYLRTIASQEVFNLRILEKEEEGNA